MLQIDQQVTPRCLVGAEHELHIVECVNSLFVNLNVTGHDMQRIVGIGPRRWAIDIYVASQSRRVEFCFSFTGKNVGDGFIKFQIRAVDTAQHRRRRAG